MKIYIVTVREGCEMHDPHVFKTSEEANEFVENLILRAARDRYDAVSESKPSKEELMKWAEERGYALEFDGYFWDGFHEGVEARITGVEV